jgi:hypothetical protein
MSSVMICCATQTNFNMSLLECQPVLTNLFSELVLYDVINRNKVSIH